MYTKSLVALLLAICCLQVTLGKLGCDYMGMDQIGPNEWSCLKNKGFDFAILKVWIHGKGLNTNLDTLARTAIKQGFSFVDLSISLCPMIEADKPDIVVPQLKTYLTEKGLVYRRLWIEVDDHTRGCFSPSSKVNAAFLATLIIQLHKHGIKMGIYTRKWTMLGLVGPHANRYVTGLPLWYSHCDRTPSFQDRTFYTFASWKNPSMKEYRTDQIVCGVPVNYNYIQDQNESIDIDPDTEAEQADTEANSDEEIANESNLDSYSDEELAIFESQMI
eukprot:TRINITY_DN7004_c0_g1_i2.p1 TRINITY_DN7004_c0_g1~~TRINITY_DN7004_c0_g1_i2.p1  ORF type:complete len:275 (+),score=40.24 TRINITY_DN7004_c0_g1_i2:167-991(+)